MSKQQLKFLFQKGVDINTKMDNKIDTDFIIHIT